MIADPPLNAALAATLDVIARASRAARDPWWLIGSAAMALHGAEVEVGDVDVLTSIGDVEAFRLALDGAQIPSRPSDRFRSRLFIEAVGAPLKIEIMAGFEVLQAGVWRPVAPTTRQAITWKRHDVFVPDLAELADLCRLFGRPKDLERATTLDALIAAR